MPDLSSLDPTGRFTGLADLYARHRPDYPASALDSISAHCRLGPDTLLVDVGAGTGIAARLFAARGIPVLGIEPNDEMRTQAEAVPVTTGPAPRYLPGRAEATGLPAESAAAVLAAQAFHWFDAPLALAEFRRILRPGGWVVLMANERDESDPLTAAYGTILRQGPGGVRVEANRAQVGAPLLASPLFAAGERLVFPHEQELDEEGLLGRAFSASYAPREPEAVARFRAALQNVFAVHQVQGRVKLCYQTIVYLARRRDQASMAPPPTTGEES